MLKNQAPTAGLDDSTPWDALYEQAADQSSDLVSEVRSAVEHGTHDPADSVEMACAAAETTWASGQALSNPWSLYTPQDAATVASALFVQLQYTPTPSRNSRARSAGSSSEARPNCPPRPVPGSQRT
jgi:hypothetical protein